MRQQSGFSLMELMVVMIIMAIITAIAAPAFSGMVTTQRIKALSFDFIASFSFARGEALKQNTNITITPNTGGWINGWRVMNGTEELRSISTSSNNLTITTSATSIVFGRSGRVTTGMGSTFQIGPTETMDGVSSRCITLDTMGIPRAKNGAC